MEKKKENNNLRSTITLVFFAFSFGMLLSAVVMRSGNAPKEETSPALISYKGQDITIKDLPMTIAMPLFELENSAYDQKSRLLEEAAIQLHVAELAKANGQTEDEARAELFKIDPVTDEALNTFYNANQKNIKRPFFEIKDNIKQYLMAQTIHEKRQAFLNKWKKDGNLAVLLTAPVSPVVTIDTTGYPSKGNPKSGVKVVEFADYQCPHCKHANETLHSLLKTNEDKFELVYMDFPINRSGISRTVAEGAVCADSQKKFWEYHDAAFELQSSLNKETPLAIAKKLKLDEAAFNLCLSDKTTKEKVRTAEKQAIHLGATGTPTIFINGRLYQGKNNNEALKTAILNAKVL